MAAKKSSRTPARKPAAKAAGKARIQRRFWLTYPVSRIKAPVIWELAQRFPVVTNIRQASITDEVGIVCLEIDGTPDVINAGVRWMKKVGLSVEPVELSTVAG